MRKHDLGDFSCYHWEAQQLIAATEGVSIETSLSVAMWARLNSIPQEEDYA
jgi:hypothetical protein